MRLFNKIVEHIIIFLFSPPFVLLISAVTAVIAGLKAIVMVNITTLTRPLYVRLEEFIQTAVLDRSFTTIKVCSLLTYLGLIAITTPKIVFHFINLIRSGMTQNIKIV